MKNIFDFSGKKMLIAGASSGIGRQTAITLSQLGAEMVLIARRKDLLEETLSSMEGNNNVAIPFDLNEIGSIDNLLESIVDEHGKLDGLVYTAGVAEVRPYKICVPDDMERIMRINFFSFYELVRNFAKKKISNDYSSVVAISSAAAVRPGKGQAAYAASKAAMEASILVLAQELLKRNININSIRPGWVRSPLTKDYSVDNPKYDHNIQPMGIIESEDVASLVAYLLSEKARKITGRGFELDGGRLCRE